MTKLLIISVGLRSSSRCYTTMESGSEELISVVVQPRGKTKISRYHCNLMGSLFKHSIHASIQDYYVSSLPCALSSYSLAVGTNDKTHSEIVISKNCYGFREEYATVVFSIPNLRERFLFPSLERWFYVFWARDCQLCHIHRLSLSG